MVDFEGEIETYTGGTIDPFDPDPDDILLEDIAASLAHTCRFGGHTKHFYSVAHHSLHVRHELRAEPPRVQLFGILHDAGEAYLGDVPRPLKAKLDPIDQAEDQLLAAVWSAVDVAPPTPDEWERVMAADDRLLAYEAATVLEGGSWGDAPPALGYDLRSDPIDAIREQFLSRTETLLTRVD